MLGSIGPYVGEVLTEWCLIGIWLWASRGGDFQEGARAVWNWAYRRTGWVRGEFSVEPSV